MNRYLLDTSTVLIAQTDPALLAPAVHEALLRGAKFLSVVSFWEVLLKSMKGSLNVGDPRAWWTEALDQLAAAPLALRPKHVAEVYTLPPIHRDPFDRVLIAQAIAEDLRFVTTDHQISRYASARFRVVC